MEGRFDEIRTCIACNTCMESIFHKGRLECLVNPSPGREREMAITQTKSPRRVMVIGGGPTDCEAAWHLARQGAAVTVVEMTSEIGRGMESITKRMLLRKLLEMGVKILSGWKLVRVKADGVCLTGADGGRRFVRADRGVIATGLIPDDRLYRSIEPLGYEIHRIGDCQEPRTAKAAIYEAAVIARKI